MNATTNPFNQPVGLPLSDWSPPQRPEPIPLKGNFVLLEPLDPSTHAKALFEAYADDAAGCNWTYLPYGPFPTFEAYLAWLQKVSENASYQLYTIVPTTTGLPSGMAGYLRIEPEAGSIEVGHLHYSERLKKGSAATEAMFLMMRHAFELGYRRYEWKCDALNAGSRRAAERLGFVFEGIFRQALVYKGRNRDTAWYSIIDPEWPALKAAFEQWLDPVNFDAQGQQIQRLRTLVLETRS